jgi:hypothetical protein
MVFSDSATKQGIVEDIDKWAGTNATSYPLVDKTRDVNAWLDLVVALIMTADGRWQFDDANYLNANNATDDLVENQQDYTISGLSFLNISRVEVKDANGKYYELQPMDEHDVKGLGMTSFHETAGRPVCYDKRGDSINIYPKPSASLVTLSEGIKIYFQRVGSYFVSADTTKSPGFNPLFHRILSLGPALDYCSQNGLTTKVNIITPRLDELKKGLVDAYASRSKDENVRMRVRRENYGAEGGCAVSDKMAF